MCVLVLSMSLCLPLVANVSIIPCYLWYNLTFCCWNKGSIWVGEVREKILSFNFIHHRNFIWVILTLFNIQMSNLWGIYTKKEQLDSRQLNFISYLPEILSSGLQNSFSSPLPLDVYFLLCGRGSVCSTSICFSWSKWTS